MLESLREVSWQWYTALSQFEARLSDPVGLLAMRLNIPILSAFLFGVLGSLAPCQMSANAGAIAYLSSRAGGGRRVVWSTAWSYVLGKVAVYTLLGAAAILLGLRLPTAAMAVLRKLFGPFMVLFGLHLLGLVRLRFTAGGRLAERFDSWIAATGKDRGAAGAFALGATYSLAFCPTMALVFFGLLVPLGLRTPGGIALPPVFALGTALPLLIFAAFVTLGMGLVSDWHRRVRAWDRWLRVGAGVVFLLFGLNDTILYWFL